MNKLSEKITTEELLFYAYFIIMVTAKGIGLVNGNVIYNLCLLTGTFLVIAKIMIGEYKVSEYLLIAALLLLGIIIWRVSSNQAALICLTLVVSMKNISVKKTFQIGAICWSFCFVFQIMSQLMNLRTRDFVIHNKYHLGYLIHWALGYSHPNVLQIAYMVLISYLLYTITWQSKNIWKIFFLSAAGALYIFLYSLSITGMLFFGVFWILLFYFDWNRRIGRHRSAAENVLLEMIFPVSAGISVLGPIMLNGRAFDIINRLMTTRPALSRRFMTEYGMSLFGQNFTGLSAVLTLDCSYVHLLMYNGVILFVLMCIGYCMMIHERIWIYDDHENDMALVIILSALVAGISEPFLFNESYKNLSLIFLGAWVMNRQAAAGKRTMRMIALQKHLYVTIHLNHLQSIGQYIIGTLRKQSKKIILVSIICAVMGGLAYYYTAHLPQDVYALRTSCDTDDYSVNRFLSQQQVDQLRNSGNTWVLNYKDSDTPMLRFEGRIITVERLRGVISSAFWLGIAGGVITLAGVMGMNRRKKKDV